MKSSVLRLDEPSSKHVFFKLKMQQDLKMHLLVLAHHDCRRDHSNIFYLNHLKFNLILNLRSLTA